MDRHEFLAGVHAAYQPRNYIEIGINDGRGLHLSRTRTIGVDPAFKITAEFECDLKMVRATSDEFFARKDAIARFPEGVVDLSFIDGLHIFEFALRDFINAERLSSASSVVIFDDMLPRAVPEAARDRHTMQWTGDVFKVAQVLTKYRPDLIQVPIDTTPTGMLLVLGVDPSSTVLHDNYDEILAEFVVDDPQIIPEATLHRREAADPQQVLDLSMWADLVAAREAGGSAPDTVKSARDLVGTATYVSNPPRYKPYPPRKPVAVTPQSPAAGPPVAPKIGDRIRQVIKRRF
jgi:hypothetical protein